MVRVSLQQSEAPRSKLPEVGEAFNHAYVLLGVEYYLNNEMPHLMCEYLMNEDFTGALKKICEIV